MYGFGQIKFNNNNKIHQKMKFTRQKQTKAKAEQRRLYDWGDNFCRYVASIRKEWKEAKKEKTAQKPRCKCKHCEKGCVLTYAQTHEKWCKSKKWTKYLPLDSCYFNNILYCWPWFYILTKYPINLTANCLYLHH